MAWLSLGFFFGATVLLLSGGLVSALIARRRTQVEAARQSCEAPFSLTSKNFLRLTRLLSMLKVTREERGPQYLMERASMPGQENMFIP